jgi:hypothetical protein
MADLVLLTRHGCQNTSEMRANLNAALDRLGLRDDLQIIDIGTLPPVDERTGYPTPTLLYNGRDVFGMPAPVPPFSPPS